MLEKFNNHYQVAVDNVMATDELINEYSPKVPAELINIWKTTGLGKYNHGLIELINPKDYESNLWTWLGREVKNYTPFAITGFGELLYYRSLTDMDEDVCMLDIQYRKIEVLSWNLASFFEDFLTNEGEKKAWLREDLFTSAIAALGNLQKGEVFTFVPIFAMGGAEQLDHLKKGDARVYQDLVFQMTS